MSLTMRMSIQAAALRVAVLLLVSGGWALLAEQAIVGRSGSTLRNGLTGQFGMKFEVSKPVTVTHLGRWNSVGNKEAHVVRLLAGTKEMARVTIDTRAGTAEQMQYAPLPQAVECVPGVEYYLLSEERKGGDQWHNYDDPVTPHPLIKILNSAWTAGPLAYDHNPGCYGPVSFQFSPSAPRVVQPPTSVGAQQSLTWDDPNPPGSTASWTVYATNRVASHSATTTIPRIDFQTLMKDAPSGDYTCYVRATSTNGIMSEPSTNLPVRWQKP